MVIAPVTRPVGKEPDRRIIEPQVHADALCRFSDPTQTGRTGRAAGLADPFGPSACIWCAPKGAITLWVEVPPGQWSVWPGSWQAAWVGNCPRRSPATKAALGGRATRRAVTCVKPEQASKGKLWTPTRPDVGEGSTVRGSSRQMHLDRSTGVMGTARRDRGLRKRGRPVLDGGRGLNGAARRQSVRESDRVVVPPKPGNSGGGKGPDFWCACRRRRRRVTWRKPVKHRVVPGAFRASCVALPRRSGDTDERACRPPVVCSR